MVDNQQGQLELVSISVGKPFPLFTETMTRLKGVDGAFFEASDLEQGYMFCIHFSGVNQKEIDAIRKNPISVRMIEQDGLVLPMINFGQNMIFEMVFDPTLYPDARALQLVDTNNLLTIYLIDSNTGILEAIRQANLPLKMIRTCKEAWSRAILEPNFSARFTTWYKTLQTHPLEELWKRAVYVGKMGERFDLDEIKVPNTGGKE